ncbi:hypothetical protein PAXINDRAFT_13818 [Paxillus involutus ATCC 200175]|uniref:Retrotransposon Copia-like N-terminal domain-containing protein n=1 Tax=Paxillus involutus ATCC 200175 TaxID=664439 RepID=A0A0C9TT94_PAXIN|nr:hypothetical protein PAXINDRAFT_13818 [Paxillus involutus ATCC 200175]
MAESNEMIKNVPKFNGRNFINWQPAMEAYLMQLGAWRVVNGTTTAPADAAAQLAWDLLDDRAGGSIRLTLGPLFAHMALPQGAPVAGIVTAGSRRTWQALQARFSDTGAAGVFVDFSHAVKFKIHDRDDVPTKLGELDSIFHRLTALALPENLRAMIMLSALPDSWDNIASTLLGTTAIAALTPNTIIPKIHEESARRKGHHMSSNRLSVIKRTNTSQGCAVCKRTNHTTENHWYKPSDDQQAGPSNYQQASRGNTRGRGRGRGTRGTRGTRGRGRGKGKGRAGNSAEIMVANAAEIYHGDYDYDYTSGYIEDYDDDTTSNKADVTFPSLNKPSADEEATNFFLDGIRNGTISTSGF